VNGQCSTCLSLCATCSPTSAITCLSCIPTYGLIGNVCVKFCNNGWSIIDVVCKCPSGIIYSEKCVATCPDGTVNIQNKC
jgi:hypothetical protein